MDSPSAGYQMFHVNREGQEIIFNDTIRMTPAIALLIAGQLILHVEHSILEKEYKCVAVHPEKTPEELDAPASNCQSIPESAAR